jgi:hypothetical protein
MNHRCIELRYLIYVINQIITSNKSSMNKGNLFSNMIKDLSIPSSPIIFGNEERTNCLISSTPLLCSRQIHSPITINRSKVSTIIINFFKIISFRYVYFVKNLLMMIVMMLCINCVDYYHLLLQIYRFKPFFFEYKDVFFALYCI